MKKLLEYFSEASDCQDVSMDDSVIRAHARGRHSSANNEAVGHSKGGFGSKIDALSKSNCNGQVNLESVVTSLDFKN